jgi:hypothetical protein
VAKRVRGSRSAHRPGGQGPHRGRRDRSGASEATDAATALPTADVDGAIDTVTAEYAEVATEAPATTTKRRRQRRSARAQAESLEGRAAAEGAYVREDLRRIGIISLVLLVGLVIAWILFYALDILNLY